MWDQELVLLLWTPRDWTSWIPYRCVLVSNKLPSSRAEQKLKLTVKLKVKVLFTASQRHWRGPALWEQIVSRRRLEKLRSRLVWVQQVPLWKVISQRLESLWTWPWGALMGNTVLSENKCPSDCSPARSGSRLPVRGRQLQLHNSFTKRS